jgi:hypothetical protein
VDKVALGQVFSEYFGFPCKFSFHQLPHSLYHPGLVQQTRYKKKLKPYQISQNGGTKVVHET